MRAFALSLALLAAVASSRSAAAASVAVDVVHEQFADEVGERDVWGLWLRTSPGVQVSSLYVFVNLSGLESVAIDASNPDIDISSIQSDILGDSIPLLFAAGLSPALVGPGASGRIATLTGLPHESPPHTFILPELIPTENVYGSEFPSIDPTNTSGSPLSILSLSGPRACLPGTCEIPTAPLTDVRWLWEVPEPRAAALLAAALALLARRRRA
jgi:hypothetical protein